MASKQMRIGLLGLALGLLGTLYFGLGMIGWIDRTHLAAVSLIWLAGTLAVLARRGTAPPRRCDLSSRFGLYLLLALFCFVILILGQLPPVARDALIQHLAFPKLFLKEQALVTIPSVTFSWYPMLVDLLFLLPLSFGNETLPASIHALFGLMSARLLFLYLEKEFGLRWAWFGLFLFLTVPVIFFLSTVAYVDLALVFYGFMGLLGLLRWRDEQNEGRGGKRWLVLSGLSVGAAMATKYNGYILFGFSLAATGLFSARARRESPREPVKQMALFALWAFLPALPWLIRNWIDRGNPVFPLLSGFWGGSGGGSPGIPPLLLRHELYHESWLQILALPLRVFVAGEENDPARFDGRLNPLFLLMPLFVLAGSPRCWRTRGFLHRDTPFFCGFVLTYLFSAMILGSARVRYLVPLIPPLVILSVAGLARLREAVPRLPMATAVAVLALCFNGISIAGQIETLRPWNYLLGKESREAYLSDRLAEYPVYTYLNGHLPSKAIVLLVFTGNRGFYCDRAYLYDSPIDGNTLLRITEESASIDEIEQRLRGRGITHIVMNRPLLVHYFSVRLEDGKWKLFQEFARKRLKLLYGNHPFYLFEVYHVGWEEHRRPDPRLQRRKIDRAGD